MSVLTRQETASRLGVTERHVDRLLVANKLVKVETKGTAVRITSESIEQYIADYKPWLAMESA